MNSTDLNSLSTGASLAVSTTGPASAANLGSTKAAGTFQREESLLDFAHWLAVVQNIPAQTVGDSLQLGFTEKTRRIRKSAQLQTLSPNSLLELESIEDFPEPLTLLIAGLRDGGAPAHLRPAGTVDAVHAVTEKLFPSYDVEEGTVHLQGCQLEPRPFVRVSFLVPADLDSSDKHSADKQSRVRHVYVAPDGSSVADHIAEKLQLGNTEPLDLPPARIANNQLDAMVGAGRRMAAQIQNHRNPAASAGEPLAVAVVWVRYAEGQLQFEIGQATARLPFEGWIRDLVAPKYPCPATGVETFRLAALDDGRIVAAEQAAKCDKSGTRTLKSELSQCCVTGKQVLPEFTTACPILGQSALTEHFALCSVCQEEVSTAALSNSHSKGDSEGVCQACRQLKSIKKEDPRLAEILQSYSGLTNRKWWQIAETANVTIVVASHLFSQAMLVCDRRSLECKRPVVKHLATRRRGASRWVVVDLAKRDEILGVSQ